MTNSNQKTGSSHAISRMLIACAVALFVLIAGSIQTAAQSFDFDAGNDSGWQHYSLPGEWAAAFSFPPDGAGGKAYRIYAPPTGDDPWGLGNARAGSFLPNPYLGRFAMGADLLAWNADWQQEAGLLFYLQDIGPGTSDGYAATYSSGYKRLYISAVLDERPITVAEIGGGSLILDPARQYRLVASTHDGYTFLFQLFDKAYPESPMVSAIGQDSSYYSGVSGFLVFEQRYPSATEGADATFDNYFAGVPPAGAMPAVVTDLSPWPGSQARDFYPKVTVCILDRDTSVDTDAIELWMDGQPVPTASLSIEPVVAKPENPASTPREFSGATVTYEIATLLPWGKQHTNKIVFKDNTGASHSAEWTWTHSYPNLLASSSLPLGSLRIRGFDARMVQSENQGSNLDNSLARAERQLAVPPQIPVDRAATSLVQVLDWNKTLDPPNNVPGLCAGTYINIAVECMAYLELKAGVNRFHVVSDDRCGIYLGFKPGAPDTQVMWENPDNTANATFEFAVEADGLYPVRLVWEETGGSANLRLTSVNPDDLSEVLINDPDNPLGVVKAWYPLVCLSTASLAGPWAVESEASNSVNTMDVQGQDCAPVQVGSMVTGGTFVAPISGSTRFYRIQGPRPVRITQFEKTATNVRIDYQIE